MTPTTPAPADPAALSERLRALRAKADVRGELRLDDGVMRDTAADLVAVAVFSYSRKEVGDLALALVNNLDAILAALTSAAPGSGTGWRDIATAPRDGMFLVANARGEVCPMSRENGDGVVLSEPGHADWTGGWATHWQPLPSPPGAAEEDGR